MKVLSKFILAFLILSCICPVQLWAATYYIATTGNDSTGTGLIGAPWNKFSKAAAVMTCGDTLYVRGGTYTYDDTPRFGPTTCTVATPLIITNYPGESPIWHPTNQGDAFINRFYISQSSGFTVPITDVQISGLELWGLYECVKLQGSLRFVFRGNNCHGSWNNGITGTNTGGNKDATIDRNIIASNGSYTGSACVSNPTPTCNQSHGLYIMGTGWIITNNIIYDNLGYGLQARAGTPSPTPNASTYGGFTGLVANNTLAYSRNRAAITPWAETVALANTTFENNVCYENSQNYGSSSQCFEFVGGGGYSNVVIRNNIWYGTGNSVIFLRNNAGGTTAPAGVTVTSTTNANPLFVNGTATLPASPDFHLQTAPVPSPAIGIGFNLTGIVLTDYYGNTRVAPYDDGAVMSGTAPPDTTAPAAPQGLQVSQAGGGR